MRVPLCEYFIVFLHIAFFATWLIELVKDSYSFVEFSDFELGLFIQYSTGNRF